MLIKYMIKLDTDDIQFFMSKKRSDFYFLVLKFYNSSSRECRFRTLDSWRPSFI